MPDNNGYAVFFYPKALEALGEGIKPYLQDGPAGVHIVCREVDTGGALVKMTLDARTTAGDTIQLELLVPTSMVLMIVSARTDEAFGFGPRIAVEAARPAGEGTGAQVEVKAGGAAAKKPSKKMPPKAAKKAKPAKSKPAGAPRKRSKKK
ncbi:hypothetical protein [Novilysobacter erysipheiresistens]|uniref:Uncharacterized protein n=1 Tax=Novilysobacter erysipheiresistens TaxID=1749332 RepID=A0ABU7YWS1_9GAMM